MSQRVDLKNLILSQQRNQRIWPSSFGDQLTDRRCSSSLEVSHEFCTLGYLQYWPPLKLLHCSQSYDEAKWHWRNDCREAQLEACMAADQAAIFDTMRERTCCSQLRSENMLPCHILAVTRSHARCDFTLCIYPASLEIMCMATDKVFLQ